VGKCRLLARALHFDQRIVFGRDEVEIDGRHLVLFVVQIEQRHSIAYSRAHSCEEFFNGRFRNFLFCHEPPTRHCQRDTRTRDRGRSGPAIRLEHVAIDPNCASPKFFQIDHGSHRATDESLDFAASAVEFSFRNVARFSGQR